MGDFFTGEAIIALLTLTSLELVLGIDNIIFIAILASRLPVDQRDRARRLGLLLAVISRVLLVLGIGWVMGLKKGLFTLSGHEFTGKDMILIFGGLFLLGKATWEIHHKVGHARQDEADFVPVVASLKAVLIQVLMIDVVFSLDSVITAVGMTDTLPRPIPIMIAAIIISVLGMLWFSKAIVNFIEQHPAIKILALSFLLLIGILLVAEGFHHKIPKGYVYFAMAFSFGVEILQMLTEKKKHPEAPPSQY
ncbi:MAG: TerC family protein [Planctomyces sp.]|nr:TerC family protein [Planctomyces sp.]